MLPEYELSLCAQADHLVYNDDDDDDDDGDVALLVLLPKSMISRWADAGPANRVMWRRLIMDADQRLIIGWIVMSMIVKWADEIDDQMNHLATKLTILSFPHKCLANGC